MNAQEVTITEDEYETLLDEIFGPVSVGSFTWDAGYVLKELDPIAFHCGMSEEPSKCECDECGEIFKDKDEANECCNEEE